ncbi:MAG: hypothetical protein CL946_10390, partial [Ectothiorhodospiraceae bacterium]|nr:hypothetical protein [Ectothiorhodospiraceae bacterium]
KKSAKKPGPKPQKAKSTAAKKSTPKKTTGKKRGPGRPKKAAPAPAAPAVKAAAASDDFLFGNDLKKEIARTEARLDYLKSLEKAQNEYVKAMQ